MNQENPMPKVLISDPMDPRAAEIFRANGVEVDEKPGLTRDELKRVIGDYDGLAIRSPGSASTMSTVPPPARAAWW